MKRIVILIPIIIIMIFSNTVFAYSADSLKIFVDGKEFEMKPVVIEGTTMVSVRDVFNAVGVRFEAISDLKAVLGVKGDKAVLIPYNSKNGLVIYGLSEKELFKDLTSYEIKEFSTKNINGRLHVPLRTVVQLLEDTVSYDLTKKAVNITTKKLEQESIEIKTVLEIINNQVSKSKAQADINQIDLSKEKSVVLDIKTGKGDIKIEVYPELMPVTVENFLVLVKNNFYDGLSYHRVEDWVIQGGDPKGDGTGGSEKTIKLETNEKLLNLRGAVAMARSADPDSASSQFYILKKDASWLDGQYAVFGRVVDGMEVIDMIEIGDKIVDVYIPDDNQN